jgi:hypothetical protein
LITFELTEVLVALPLARLLPHGLESIRVPVRVLGGSLFRADVRATEIVRPDGSSLLRFGATRLSSALTLQPSTGEVVWINDAEAPVWRGRPVPWSEVVANSNLELFVETARVVTARFPFYERGTAMDGDAQCAAAANDLRRLIAAVDPPATREGRLWSMFADDVETGDFDTQQVLQVEAHSRVTLRNAD